MSADKLTFPIEDVATYDQVEHAAVVRIVGYTKWTHEKALEHVRSGGCSSELTETTPPHGRARARYAGTVTVTV